MAPLSSAAEAIWEEFNEEKAGVFVDYGEKLAAAIRRLAEEVVLSKYSTSDWEVAHLIMQEMQAIADELDGAQ